jgi:hypothetical protein
MDGCAVPTTHARSHESSETARANRYRNSFRQWPSSSRGSPPTLRRLCRAVSCARSARCPRSAALSRCWALTPSLVRHGQRQTLAVCVLREPDSSFLASGRRVAHHFGRARAGGPGRFRFQVRGCERHKNLQGAGTPLRSAEPAGVRSSDDCAFRDSPPPPARWLRSKSPPARRT